MRDVSRALLIAAALLLLSVSTHFTLATVAAFAVNGALVFMFRPQPGIVAAPLRTRGPSAAILAAAAAASLLAVTAREWLQQILTFPIDAQRADMLVVIQEGIRRLLRGQNPYAIFHVPWDATLPYGPVMWLPYVAPHVLRIDVRVVSLAGALFVPVACAMAAVAATASGRYAASAAPLIVLGAIAASADLRNFASIAHTPVYWPLLALFAWLVARRRWYASAVTCGLLIVARTTMIAVAPVLLIALWYHDRRRAPLAAACLAAALILPYLPFAIWDPSALAYAVYGSYQHLMKEFVWTQTRWAHNTIGVTGWLLRSGRPSLVEAAQVLVMAAVYGAAWRSIRRGVPPLPWMAFALFAFSATTLWPVHYIYLDVTILWASAALAESPWLAARRIGTAWLATLTATVLLVGVVATADIRRQPSIDVGIGATRPLLYHGFANNEGTERTFAWVDGTSADLVLARRTRSDATIEIVCQPHLPTAQSSQHMSAALNGIVLGNVALREGWQPVTFDAPARAWRIGVNELALSFSSASSPRETGTGDDPRKLSAAIDRLTVRTRQ